MDKPQGVLETPKGVGEFGVNNKIFIGTLSYHQPLERLRNQFRILAPGFFWSLSWAVIAQNVILSPQSHVMDCDPIPSPLAAASINGLFDSVFLQLGHLIWYSIICSFLSKCYKHPQRQRGGNAGFSVGKPFRLTSRQSYQPQSRKEFPSSLLFFFIRFIGCDHAKGINPSHDRFNKKA
jgi:hypothetical protein